MKHTLPYIAVLISMVLWSISPIMTKTALQVLTPLTIVSMRFTVSVLLMLLFGLLCRHIRPLQALSLQKLRRQDIPLFLLCGFVEPFLYYMFETYGLRLSASPTVSEVLLSTSPLFAPLFAWALIQERITVNNILGILISTGGVVLMLLAGNQNFEMGSVWGIPLLFMAVFSAVFYTILLHRMPSHYNSLSVVFWGQLFSLLFFYPTFCIVDLPTLLQTGIPSVGLDKALMAVGYLSLCASVIAFVLFCYTIRNIGVTRANAFNNIRPVFTALFMLLLFGERLPLLKWVGMALVIAGLFVCQYTKKNVPLQGK